MARAFLLGLQDPVRLSGALEAFERAIALEPRNPEAHYQYGQALMILGSWSQAHDAYLRTIALDPALSQTLVSTASIAWKLKRIDEARRWYDSALALNPSSSYAHSARAVFRLAQGDVRGGLEDAETAVRVEEGYSIPPHSVLAVALARSGGEERERANAEISRALSAVVDPKAPSPTDTRFIASALVALGRVNEALDFIERARPRGAWLWFYCLAADFDPIRSHPRFVRVMQDAKR
jgi:tetratricopeptide (TPR) repeat protein